MWGKPVDSPRGTTDKAQSIGGEWILSMAIISKEEIEEFKRDAGKRTVA
jgi:hypothetical protein